MQNPQDPDAADLATFLADAERVTAALELVVADRGLLAYIDPELRQRLLVAAGLVSKPDAKDRRRLNRAHRRREKVDKREEQRALLNQTQIRQLRENPIFLTPKRIAARDPEAATPPIGEVQGARTCYVCREKYNDIHFFYDQMCPTCGDQNFAKRTQEADLRGRVALVTGSRVKIGYQAAIFLLRSGAHVIVTTRFPRDAARRYAAEADFPEWGHRLEIHGIDLRDIPSVEDFCARINATHHRLDVIINNACQTVRRPPGFYEHLLQLEHDLEASLTSSERALLPVPEARLDSTAWL